MTFTPEPHGTWDGVRPLHAGLAIERSLKGTLGVAVELPSGTYVTAARHVAGRPPTAAQAMGVFRGGASWDTTTDLERLDALAEPGAELILDSLDIAFLRAPASVQNVTPDASVPQQGIGVARAGDTLHLRGSRHEDWIETEYEDDFGQQHEHLFTGLLLEREHLGIIELGPLGPAAQQEGNSGTALWVWRTAGFAVVGHLVAVSFREAKGLIVLYRSALRQLGLTQLSVKKEVVT